MKNFTVPIKDTAKNEGYTQVELQARVRLRAYEIYQQRDRVDGHALDDWAQAEAEILQPLHRSAAA
jgi:hypothetical protein